MFLNDNKIENQKLINLLLLFFTLLHINQNVRFVKCINIQSNNNNNNNKNNNDAFYPETCHLIPDKDQIVFANYNNDTSTRTRRNTKEGDNLIIHTHYHDSFHKLPKKIMELYHDKLIPEAIDYWQSSLKVKYPYFPIYLGRVCSTSQVYYTESSKSVSCESNCSQVTKCGEYIVIPEEHLDVCRYCTNGNNCKEKGNRSAGVKADFILYISSIKTEHCDVSNTVAFASYCQLESKYNRPVAGYVNICPQSVSSKQSDTHSALATLKHEILHALGFSAGLYAFFLDSNGKPLTDRNPNTGKPPFNPKTNMYEPSEKVVKVITRPNWKVKRGEITRNVTMIVTPRVVNEVRKHFNCSTLEGAELEDQGEIGTKYTHWEKRVYENEAMTGTYTQNSVFSRITFAFLEDTGWYTADYSFAENLYWGKELGCEFAKASCRSWIEKQKLQHSSIRPYCNTLPTASESHSKYECNMNRDAVLLCNLMRYNQIPADYQNFDHPDIGGSVVLADYCPFMQQVSWSLNNDIVRDSKCIYEENRPERQKNYVLEEYGRDMRCFLHNRTWHIYSDRCQSRITVSKTVGCYKYDCDTNKGLIIYVKDKRIVCSHKDQVINFVLTSDERNVYFGNIICPSCEELCKDKIKCPNERYDSSNSQIHSNDNYIHKSISSEYNHLHNQHEYCIRETLGSSSHISPLSFIYYILINSIVYIYLFY